MFGTYVCIVDSQPYSSTTQATVYLCGIAKTSTLANPYSYIFLINSSSTLYLPFIFI